MAIQNLPKRWSTKPPVGTQINWGHPLGNGLVSCFIFNEQAGAQCFDLATGGIAKNTIGAEPWAVKPPVGVALDLTANLYAFAENNVGPFVFPITLVSIWMPSNMVNLPIIWLHDDGSVSSGFGMITTTTQIRFNLGGVNSYTFTNLTVANFNTYFSAITVDKNAGTATGYHAILGSPLTVQALAIGTRSATTPIRICFGLLQSSATGSHWAFMHLLYNRMLTPSEINQLNINPYCFLVSPSPHVRQYKQAPPAVSTLVPSIFQNPVDPLSVISV